MSTFEDASGKKWTVSITVSTIKRVKRLLDIDLLEIADGSLISKLIHDPITLVNVLYVVCMKECEAAGMTDEDFGELMAGDVIERATGAMLDALVFFTPNPRDRENLTLMLRKTNELMETARDQVGLEIKSGAIERIAEEAIATLGKPSMNSQG